MTLRNENGALRGLSGSGEPGLHTLLGGTGEEKDASGLKTFGGAGQVSAVARMAEAYKDTRLAAVAAGNAAPGTTAGGGRSGEAGWSDPVAK